MRKLFTLILVLVYSFSYAQSTTVVISQVYGGGGSNSGTPTYKADFIELHNVSSVTQSLDGFSLQYASATGNFSNFYPIPAGTSIPAGGYLLIQCGTVGTAGADFPVTPDLINTSLSLSSSSGKVALSNVATALGCGATGALCTLPATTIVDLVSYGASNNAEGGVSVNNGVAFTNVQGASRKNNGCTETDNNNADFDVVTAPVPRKSTTPVNLCTSVVSPALTIGSYNTFAGTVVGMGSSSQSASLAGTNLTGAPGTISVTSGSTDFQVSSDNSTWGASTSIVYGSATLASTLVYVKFTPQASGARTGTISFSGGGANTSVSVTGTGLALSAPVATAATAINGTGFSANWNAVIGATGYFLDVYTQAPGMVTSTICGWNFATSAVASQTADAGNASNLGIQTVSLTGLSGNTVSWPSGPSGSAGTPNPYSVSSTGWDGGANLKYWQADVNTTGATSITVSSLQGSSTTGPKDFKLQYKVGSAGTWTDVANGVVSLTTGVVAGNLTTWGGLTDIPLPADASNQALVSLRWIMTSNTPVSSGTAVVATGTSRISAIYIKGTVPGTVNTYILNNQNVGNVTSYAVSGLTAGTTYYYVVRAANSLTTSANSNEITVNTLNNTPSISATALTAFGTQCINTTSGANSFTLSGTNLTTANVTVAALTGFSYATTATGTYSSTLTIPSSGGSFSQEVFVKFTPTAVQSYNGNIQVSGGGVSAAINVAASGSGINTPATLTTGGASSVTGSSATLAGTITANGCGSVTAYGVEYSTTSGFTSGTQVASSNISNGSFSSSISGLAPATTYYYKAYATTSAGTAYGSQQSFTTLTPGITATALTAFGNVCVNTTAGPNSFTITGTNLTSGDITVAALTGFTYATTAAGTYTAALTIPNTGGSFTQAVYVKFTPAAIQSYNGNISISGGGIATSVQVAANGAGVNTLASVTTGAASGITISAATLAGSVGASGCGSVSAYGIEYSTTNGFGNGTGTQVSSSNISAGNFSIDLSGLASGTTFYYKAYATTSAGTAYGIQQSFTTSSPDPLIVLSSLTAFGNVCINTTAGPNSFIITGTNLAAANVTVAALAGYTFSTAATGTYASTLTISNAGGSLVQEVFVKFTPAAVQSYNGNISVSGGGISSAVTVSAAGAGINTPATVSTGAASGITAITAILGGSVTSNGCGSVTAYGIEYSTTSGFVNGTGTQVTSSNISGGNYSANLSGLAAATIYYYKAYATTSAGTAYGSQQSFTTAIPAISVSALTAFGSVCTGIMAGPNSFTITGTNLTTANVTVAALDGFTYATTSTGTYASTLSIAQTGGSFSQQVFVKFNPAAVQSYSGNIAVAGGGIVAAVNVAASGSGVNTMATATTGSSSAITFNSATLAGSIGASGCSSVTAYGIEYSTTNGFANGSGTRVASSNLTSSSFSSSLSGLTASTTYYYKAYATNSGGTAYGTQQLFTTAVPPPPVMTLSTLAAFGNICVGSYAGPYSFTITGANLTNALITVGPLAGFTFSQNSTGSFSDVIGILQAGGTQNITVYVRFVPTAAQAYTGNIPVYGGGAITGGVAASGTGVNTPASVITGAATAITTTQATLSGAYSNDGCSPVTGYGIEYSSINGFTNGTGTRITATNATSGNYTVGLSGLVQGATYYYKAYVTTANTINYGVLRSFTVMSIAGGFHVFPSPAVRGTTVRITKSGLIPGNYTVLFINQQGQLVWQQQLQVQGNYINQSVNLPATMPFGIYRVVLANYAEQFDMVNLLIE